MVSIQLVIQLVNFSLVNDLRDQGLENAYVQKVQEFQIYFGCRFPITLTLGAVIPINIHGVKLVLRQFLSVFFRNGALHLLNELISVGHKHKHCSNDTRLSYQRTLSISSDRWPFMPTDQASREQ